MRNRFIVLAAAMFAAIVSAFGQSGPGDIIPTPVKYTVSDALTRLPEAGDIDIVIGKKSFFSRI